MSASSNELFEFHWLFDMLHHIDVGLVVLDTSYEIQLWSGFMENQRGVSSMNAKNKSLFKVFPDLNANWLQQKLDNAIALRTPGFISWEQRPYLFPFNSYRPITGIAAHMFQNIVLQPLNHVDGSVKYVCLVVYDVTDVATNKAALSVANKKLGIMSKTDALTGLNNRSSLDKALAATCNAFKQAPQTSHSLVMVDIDYFKKVNDQYGHQIGDQVLQAMAKMLTANSRKGDFVGRFGGEEFVILLPNTSAQDALVYCEKLREAIAGKEIDTSKGALSITISLGVSQLLEEDEGVAAWLSRADDALYQAKEQGRNRTVVL